jgi:hypothetical protein
VIGILSFSLLFKVSLTGIIAISLIVFIPLIGFRITETKSSRSGWLYYQIWQAILIIILFSVYSSLLKSDLYHH